MLMAVITTAIGEAEQEIIVRSTFKWEETTLPVFRIRATTWLVETGSITMETTTQMLGEHTILSTKTAMTPVRTGMLAIQSCTDQTTSTPSTYVSERVIRGMA